MLFTGADHALNAINSDIDKSVLVLSEPPPFVTAITSDTWLGSLTSSVADDLRICTICALRNAGRSGARTAMS